MFRIFRKKKKYYSESYQIACTVIEKLSAEKLKRSLTTTERKGIWNASSLMMLEVVERHIILAQNAQSATQELVEFAQTFERRFSESLLSLKTLLESELKRELSKAELTFIRNLPNIFALMVIGEQIKDAAPRKREAIFQELQKKEFR